MTVKYIYISSTKRNIEMAIEKALISFHGILIIVTIMSCSLAEVFCPELVMIETGSTAFVSCNVTSKEITEVYWYNGDPALRSPILQWVNGKPGGTELRKGHYDISNTGAMIITNATISHEAVYTSLMYFSDDTSESKAVTINITTRPWQQHPIIDTCIRHGDCSLLVNDTGKLSCSIRGARPVLDVQWNIKFQKGITFLEYPPVFRKDYISDTWNTSVEITYAISSCNQEAIFQCEALDYFNLLEDSRSSIHLYTANCTEELIIATKRPAVVILILVSLCIVVSAAVVYGLCISKRWHRTNTKDPEACFEDQPEITDVKALQLILDLKAKYKKSVLYDPLQRKESIKVADLYVGCFCKVRHKTEEVSFSSTDKLLTSDVISRENRVLINGASCQRTMFTKQFVRQWIQDNKNKFILLYVTKKEIQENVELISLFDLEDKEYLENVLRTLPCLLLLDGLPKINSEVKQFQESVHEGHQCPDLLNLPLSDVFRRLDRSPDPKIQLWLTTCNEKTTDDVFSRPYVKVDVKDVQEKHLENFIRLTIRQLSIENQYNIEKYPQEEEKHKMSSEDIQQPANGESASEGDTLLSEEDQPEENKIYKYHNVTFQLVKSILKETKLYQEFKEYPILLSVIVYVIISDLSPDTAFDDIEAITMEEIICKLIRRVQNAYFKGSVAKNSKELQFEEGLSNLAINLIEEAKNISLCQNSELSDTFNVALEMNLLQYSERTSHCQESKSDQFCANLIQFTHPCFQNYFAANYIVQEEERYTSVFTRIDSSRQRLILKFVIQLEHSSSKKLLQALHKYDMDDDLIDCLHKWENQDDVNLMLTSFDQGEFQLKCLYKSAQHRSVFKSFCEKCRILNVNLSSLSVVGRFPVKFMTSLDIPRIGMLTFKGIEVKESHLLSILQWLSTKDITLRFLDCKLPPVLADDVKENVKSFHKSNLKTILQPDEEKDITYSLNYKTAKWTK